MMITRGERIKLTINHVKSKGEETTVVIGETEVKSLHYKGYHYIETGEFTGVYDGEYVIDYKGRVYDVNLKQYIEWDYPIDRLFSRIPMEELEFIEEEEVDRTPAHIKKYDEFMAFLMVATFPLALILSIIGDVYVYILLLIITGLDVIESILRVRAGVPFESIPAKIITTGGFILMLYLLLSTM